MKKFKFILGCVANVIKKNIFKDGDAAISQECEKVLKDINLKIESEEEKREAEYISNYSATTRWQTI